MGEIAEPTIDDNLHDRGWCSGVRCPGQILRGRSDEERPRDPAVDVSLLAYSTSHMHLDRDGRKHARNAGRGQEDGAKQLPALAAAIERDRPEIPDHRLAGCKVG